MTRKSCALNKWMPLLFFFVASQSWLAVAEPPAWLVHPDTFPEAHRNVGLQIGSFDMFTLAHERLAVAAREQQNLSLVYFSVNYHTKKDFLTSVAERIQMMELALQDYPWVRILREPLEGRPAFADYLLERHLGLLIGIFGADTFEKNFKIFFDGVRRFDYIRAARPEATAATLETAAPRHVPTVHDLIIEADGVSSTRGREAIANGSDATPFLKPAVIEFILQNGLYQAPKDLAKAERAYNQRYERYLAWVRRLYPQYDLSSLTRPPFVPIQSVDAQKEKFIRHVVTHLGLSLDQHFEFRATSENQLRLPSLTAPIRDNRGAAIFFGSFQTPSREQLNVLRSILNQQGVERLYVGVLRSSRKVRSSTLEQRFEQMQNAVATEFPCGRVEVLRAPDLDSTPEFVRTLRNEHGPKTLVVFGDNVFEANYQRLKEITSLRFGVVPFSGKSQSFPKGTLIIPATPMETSMVESTVESMVPATLEAVSLSGTPTGMGPCPFGFKTMGLEHFSSRALAGR